MSEVLKKDRGESAMQFLATAKELEKYTLEKCSTFPKRKMFVITETLMQLSKSIYNNVTAADSVYPTNREEAQIKVNYLIYAIANCRELAAQLDIAKMLIKQVDSLQTGKKKPVSSHLWEEWARLVKKELALLTSLSKKLRDKYKLKESTFNE